MDETGLNEPRLSEPESDPIEHTQDEALFDEPQTYYIGVGFGDRQYTLRHGVAVISRSRAGVL